MVRSGSLFDFVVAQKVLMRTLDWCNASCLQKLMMFCSVIVSTAMQQLQHPTKVLLVRVGEFFETYGIDSVLLVQWCGLNPMGRKPKVRCHTATTTLPLCVKVLEASTLTLVYRFSYCNRQGAQCGTSSRLWTASHKQGSQLQCLRRSAMWTALEMAAGPAASRYVSN